MQKLAARMLHDGPPWRRGHSFPFDVRRLDDWPPLLDLGLLKGAKGLWCLLRAREDFIPQFAEPLAHRRVGQSLHGSGVELGDHRLWRALRRPEAVPEGEVESRQPRL